jgi:hypothetical protein
MPAQCRLIQALVLAAGLLPKLHLNRHTPRAVLFARPTYGGLSLLETSIDQGFGQLMLLLGHLKLGDEIGDLIRSFATHLQLHIGSKTPFSLLKFSLYKKLDRSTLLAHIPLVLPKQGQCILRY